MTAELSIIIISYNQFSLTTGPCLQSLMTVHDLLLEIIVVDNGSDTKTVQQLKRAAYRDKRIRLLLHTDNRGFAAGNNDGIQRATGRFILMLNSDTLVPPNAATLLVRHLKAAKDHCLVGPVTNAAGNEQLIYIRAGSNETSVLAQGAEWCRHAQGSIFDTDQLSFFCVAMEKDVYQEMGGLDQSFGLGFYEDADFCCRAGQKGINLQVLEDCFVYHQGSASFSRAEFSVKKLLSANRGKFRSRHGRGEGDHVRWKNFRVLQGYLKQMQETAVSRSYLFENRLAMAYQLIPNNPLKKMRYVYQLHRLEKAGRKIISALPAEKS